MNIIYVDDELPAIDNFRLTTANFAEITELQTFQSGEDALQYAETHPVDAAFLDVEMPGLHGLELAKRLKEHDSNLRVVFVTAYSQYALEAWRVDASGYLLKPYTAADIRKELAKCAYRPLPSRRVVIRTIPTLSDALEAAGAGNILVTRESRRYLKTDEVECDLYRILSGDKQAAREYHGEYLQEYDWAEERNSQLYWKIFRKLL